MPISVSISQHSRTAMRALSLMGLTVLIGCAEVPSMSGPNWGQPPREQVKLTPAEECAIGYDLAEQVYRQVKVTDTVIKVSPRLGACGEHAVKYLRKAGYGVDETAKKAEPHHFSIETYEDKDTGGVFATAHLPRLRLSRSYRRGGTGVYPLSSVNIVREEAF